MAAGSVVTMKFINGSAEFLSALPFFLAAPRLMFISHPLAIHTMTCLAAYNRRLFQHFGLKQPIMELWPSNPGSMVTICSCL